MSAGSLFVVLDTNILVSALLTPSGNPSTILNSIIDGGLRIVFSADIMVEYRSVLSRERFEFDGNDINDLLLFIEAFGLEVNPDRSQTPLPDESDRPFFDAALEVEAVLITGNLKDFPPSDDIVAPGEFLRQYLR